MKIFGPSPCRSTKFVRRLIVYYFLDVNTAHSSHNSDKMIIQVCRGALFAALFKRIRNGRKNAADKNGEMSDSGIILPVFGHELATRTDRSARRGLGPVQKLYDERKNSPVKKLTPSTWCNCVCNSGEVSKWATHLVGKANFQTAGKLLSEKGVTLWLLSNWRRLNLNHKH